MKVLHLISGGDTGGALTHVHLLLKYLNQNMEAELVCFMEGPFSRGAAALGIPVTVLPKNPLSVLPRLRRMVREGGYDLIHCHGSRGNLMGTLLKPFAAVPVITTIHSDPRIDYLGRPAARMTYGVLNAIALRQMDHYVCISDAMRETFIRRGFPAHRISTIYNGVEFPAPPTPPEFDRLAYLRAFGLDCGADSIVVGIAARFHPVKDLPTLLRGFALAHRAHPELRLLIAGDGPGREELEALSRELGLGSAVCFAGWIDDMTAFYKAIHINVLTSLSETFPYALTEGAREQLPTVASRVGGVPKLIVHGESGLLFEAGDWEALGARLSELAASPVLRQGLGQRLFEKANEDFSAAATARHQQRIYESVLRRCGKQRDGVLICGAYGMHNLGDDAVLRAMLAELASIDPALPVTVLSRRPRETSREYGVSTVYTFNLPGFLRKMRRCRLFINGGGSLIQDVTSSRSLWYYLYTLLAAKRRGCRVMMYGCGIGPVNRPRNRALACRIINESVDAVTLRDSGSVQKLRDYGITAPLVCAASDPALRLAAAPEPEIDRAMAALGLEPRGNYFGICVRRWPGMKEKAPLFAAAAEYAYEKYGLQPVLLTFDTDQDRAVTARLRSLIRRAPCAVAEGRLPMEIMIGVVGRMQAVMSMRLHVLIFAASQAVPAAAVAYDPKVSSFLEDLGESSLVDHRTLERPEQLYAMVDAAASADRAALRQAAAHIMAQEYRNVETAQRLLQKE